MTAAGWNREGRMQMTLTPSRRQVDPSYAVLRTLVGYEVTVVASVLDGHGVVPLTLECLSSPVCWNGSVAFSVRLTGPVAAHLVPGSYEVQHADKCFVLTLGEVARELRFVHYEAYLTEPL
jgi:hypothetical protein